MECRGIRSDQTEKKFNEMDDGIQEALEQIVSRKYEEGILDEGYIGAISFGVCFCKKSCIVATVLNRRDSV